jgi:WD40 repeat protein
MAQSLENHVGESFRGLGRPWLRSLIPASKYGPRLLTFTSPESNDAITACALSPIHCFAGYRSGLIRAWRLQDGKQEGEWKLHEDDGPIMSLSTDSAGAHVAVISIPANPTIGEHPYRLAIIEVNSGDLLGSILQAGNGEIMNVRLSPDGRHAAIFGDKSGVTIRDIAGSTVGIAFSGTDVLACDWVDDNCLLATTDTGRIALANPWTDEIHFDIAITPPKKSALKEAQLNLRGVPIAISKRSNWTAVSAADGEFTRVYETDSWQVVADLSPFRKHAVIELDDPQIYARCLCFSNDSKWLFEGRSRRIYAWDTSTWTVVSQWQSQVGLAGEFVRIEDSLFAVTDIRETAMRFLPTNQIVLEELPRQFPTKEPKSNVFTMPGSIIGVSICPSGRFVAVAWGPSYQFARIRLIDLQSGRMCRELSSEGAWPVVLTDERMIYCSADPLTVTIEAIQGDGAKTELDLSGEWMDQMAVSASGRFLICLSFESRPKPKSPPTPITVHDEKTGCTFQMPGIDLPPRTPFEARHGQFDSFAYATIYELDRYSLVWQECVGAHRVSHAYLNETDGVLEIEWNADDRHWKTEHTLPTGMFGGSTAGNSERQMRFSLESSGAFTDVWDGSPDRVVAWWPSRFRVFAVSQDRLTWVGAAEGSSFAEVFRLELNEVSVEPSEGV